MIYRNYCPVTILALILLFILSCTLDPIVLDPENAGEYYILCTLSAGYHQQRIRIGRTQPEHLPVDITDAQVTIYTDVQNVSFHHINDGIYTESDEKLRVINGQTFHLNVRMQNGDRITAETTLPGDFNILHPCPGDTIEHYVSMSLDTLLLDQISWEACSGAKHYTVLIDEEDPEVSPDVVNTFKTKIFMPEFYGEDWMKPLSGEKTIESTLCVFARDSTHCFFYTHRSFLDENVDSFSDKSWDYLNNNARDYYIDKMNITGATGAFHGVAMSTVKFYMKLHIDWW